MYSYGMKATNLLQLLLYPLLLRIRLGEGGIVLFNVTHTWFATKSGLQTFIVAILSTVVLCTLYGFNDYIDRKRDMLNPKKNKSFVALVNQHHNIFLLLNVVLSTTLLIAFYNIYSANHAKYVLLLITVNAVYSLSIKKIPFADIVIVAFWGSAITLCVPVANIELSVIAGIMTGIAHVYQMLSDKDTDQQTSVSTAIVRYPNTASTQIFLLCFILATSLYYTLGNKLIAASAVLPLFFYFMLKQHEVAWHLSRIYFATIWLMLLYSVYGSF